VPRGAAAAASDGAGPIEPSAALLDAADAAREQLAQLAAVQRRPTPAADPAAPARPVPAAAEPHANREAPIIQVRIGSLDVHAEAVEPAFFPAPAAPEAPPSFAEYAALRGGAARGW
jgi:hypothetical protein